MSSHGRNAAFGGAITAIVLAAALITSPAAIATYPGGDGLIVIEASTADGVQLFTIKPDGTDMHQVTHIEPVPTADNPGASNADWSPDGRMIVFNENDCQIAIIDVDGSDLREVPAEPGHHLGVDFCEGDPSFTPDGQSVVYNRFDMRTEQVWMVNVDGTDRRLVSDACGIDPNVSPDGTLLSCKGREGDGALWVVHMDGSGAMRVSPPAVIGWKHDWAPDGSVLLFTQHPTEDDNAEIATVAPDGSGVRWLTDYPRDTGARAGSFSPDGQSIVFQLANGDGENALARMDADGSDVVQLTESAASWPGLDGVGFNEGHYPKLDWGPAQTE
jgi:Tol biopolymer transport system component